MIYRKEIDGLRALAVIPVIFFHAGFTTFSGGFVGVDIFFVISGYLITTILLNDLETNSFSIIRFYERRARRILPVLFFVILISIPFAWILLPPYELISFSKSVAAIPLLISNFFFWKDGGYFDTAAELKPLLHTWSLAVEEQYYIFFPIFILFSWRLGKKFIFWALILGIISSLIIAQIGSILKPVPNFYLLPGRVWEFALGGVLAFYYKSGGGLRSGLEQEILSLCGLISILLAIFTFSNEIPYPSIYTLLPTVGAALIILFAQKNTLVGKLLSARLFIGMGVISYSAYLWHQPVLAFAKIGAISFGDIPKIVLLFIIFTLSIFSWKYIEAPFRRNNFISSRFIYIALAVGSILFIWFGFYSSSINFAMDLESNMAKELSNNEVIYTSNINERKFIKSRIEYESISPKTIVLGSSRIMQIRSQNVGELLNFGVSGSSVEDNVAIWKLATKKFDPDLILISADPWLFNYRSGQDAWKSLEAEYYDGLSDLKINFESGVRITPANEAGDSSIFLRLYKFINIFKIASNNDSPESIDKIRRDGSHVYNFKYANRTFNEVESGANDYAKYAMMPYENSTVTKDIFEKLILQIKSERNVVLVLPPYHPKLYKFMVQEDKNFIEIEKNFREMAAKLQVHIIGSYNPEKIGCSNHEFYDGMHPKASCMNKVVKQLQ